MSVEAQGDTFLAGTPVTLFEKTAAPTFRFDVTRDGQRFLLFEPVAQTPPQMTVIVNWQAGLAK